MFKLLRAAVVLVISVGLVACGGGTEESMLAAAKAAIEKKDLPAAAIHLKNALSKNPESGEARLLLGKVLLNQGNAVAATVELRKAQDAKVDDDRVVPELARALLGTGDEVRLINQFSGMRLKDAKAAADLSTSLAVAHAARSEFDMAQQALDAALRAVPFYAPAIVVRARLKARENDIASAVLLLNGVIQREPSNERAGVFLAELLLTGKGDAGAAIEALRQVLKSHPDSTAARVGMIQALQLQQNPQAARTEFELLKKSSPRHAETLYYEAQFAYNDKDFKRAREVTEQVLKSAPNNARSLELAGAAEFQMKNYLQAEALLTKSLKLAPQQRLSRLVLAQTFLRIGEPGKALDVLKNTIEAGKADGAMWSLAGEAYLQLGDATRSEQAFQAALRAAPDDARVRTAAAVAQMARGNNSGAVAALEAVAAGPSGSRADLALVSARLRQNDLAGALKAIDGLEKKLPDEALPLQLRGRVLTMKNDLPGAIKSFEAAMAKEPAYFPPVASLAALDIKARKPDEARKRFTAFIDAQPTSWQARLALAELEARIGSPAATVTNALREAVKANPAEPTSQISLVNQLIGTGDANAALLAAQNATAALPNNTEVMEALGRAELAAGDHQRALSTFKKLASLQPRSAMPELRLADTYVAMKDIASATRALQRAAELQPGNLGILRAQARLAAADGRPDDALKVARELRKRAPEDASAYVVEGEVEAKRKNWDAAIAAYRAALKLAPSSPTTAKLYTVLLAAKRPADAERVAADWLKANPKDAGFNYFLGDITLAQNDLPRAEARYRAVLDVQPDNAMAINNVAWLLVKQGKPGGLALAQKAQQLLPGRAAVVDTLAMALESENKLPEAIEAQKRAIALDPKDSSMALRLAKLYIKAGDKGRARGELEALNKLGDKFSEQAEVTQLLRTL